MKTRKGGQIVHYKKTKWHHRWKPLRIHHMDCGPNCFYVLKYADYETCVELARRAREGIGPSIILQLLDDAYGEGHQWQEISKNGYSSKYLNDKYLNRDGEENEEVNSFFINTYLDQNEATLASLDFGDYLHFFVLLRDEEGFHAIDAQSGETYPLEDYMHYNEETHAECTLHLVSSRTHHREPYRVTLNKVKQMFPFHGELKRAEKKAESRRRQSERASMKKENRVSRKSYSKNTINSL
jgi:hypothetical protein